jgi:hypothetical protein
VILDVSLNRLRYLSDVMPANVTTLYSNRYNILEQIRDADIVVGAVLLPGAKAPNLVRREDLKTMMPGSVIVDVAVDQGGCVETIKPTTHEDPIYVVDGVIHYAVANMPGAVSRTSTLALTNATFPYALTLANKGWQTACRDDRALALGVNVVGRQGHVSGRRRGVRPRVSRRSRRCCSRHHGGAAMVDGAPRPCSAPCEQVPGPQRSITIPADWDLPQYATAGSAAVDLRNAGDTIELQPLGRVLVATGLAIALPEGTEAQIRPRSGLALRHGISIINTPCTIDSTTAARSGSRSSTSTRSRRRSPRRAHCAAAGGAVAPCRSGSRRTGCRTGRGAAGRLRQHGRR